jgi:hypothetical protein
MDLKPDSEQHELAIHRSSQAAAAWLLHPGIKVEQVRYRIQDIGNKILEQDIGSTRFDPSMAVAPWHHNWTGKMMSVVDDAPSYDDFHATHQPQACPAV